jgi:hypothetical protein
MAKKKTRRSRSGSFYDILKARTHHLNMTEVVEQFQHVDESRVKALSAMLTNYLTTNLPAAIDKRSGLQDYRTNPYVLMASAHVMDLEDPQRFAQFLFNTKLYMGLETSFGKSIEAAFVSQYPLHKDTKVKWQDAPEKVAEFAALTGLSREDKAAKRVGSVWREIDKSCVIGKRRYMVSIKSGPNCINDTQVAGMTAAITSHYKMWMAQTKKTHRGVEELDIIVGVTYGTDRTTNNKENQILAKLLDQGFEEEDRTGKPGVLIDATRKVRVYRCIGKDFWALIGNPVNPSMTQFVFLEILLALASSLKGVMTAADMETKINARIMALITGLQKLMFPRKSLPEWVREDFSDTELFYFATALTAFYDEGV